MEKMNYLISPFISAYKELYNTQHVLVRIIEEWRKSLDDNWSIKAYDCVPHDLVIAKLAGHGFDKNMICYIYSYCVSRKQSVSVNNIKSIFEEVISGIPQDSIVGPVLFDIFFSDFFYFILVALTQSFVITILSRFAKTIENLISISQSESETAINWFKDNDMIVNPGKFQATLFNKQNGNQTNQIINMDQKQICAVSKVILLGI